MSQYKNLVFLVLGVVGAFVIYRNIQPLITWFKSLFTNVQTSDLPDKKDFTNPNYVINSKIISNYVDTIIRAVDQLGTDETELDKVYHYLKDTSVENTVAVWNEFNNRQLKYNSILGDFEMLLGEKYNLYEVLKAELKDNQSEKKALINWTWLLRTKAHLI